MILPIRLVARLSIFLLCLTCSAAMAGLPGGVHHQTIWVPDFYGKKVYRHLIDQTAAPATLTTKTIDVAARKCNPNSVAVRASLLYVVCNSDWGGLDQILVYDAVRLTFVKKVSGAGSDGYAYFAGAGLVAIAFDRHGHLWVTGYNKNALYRIPASRLAAAVPTVDRQVIDSPGSPAGLTVASDGSFWVVGQYSGGILLQFPDAVLNVAGTFDHTHPLNPNPTACLSNNVGGCQAVAGLFVAPEGVAVFGGAVWVSDNGGNAPGKRLVRAAPKGDGTFTTAVYGGTAAKPFSCPGGLFAPTLAGATAQLWVNDEAYGKTATTCGATAGSQGSKVGRVLAFQSADLLAHKAAPVPQTFVGSTQLKTGSPGFGGIFVQLD